MSELGMATRILEREFRSVIPFFLVAETRVEYCRQTITTD